MFSWYHTSNSGNRDKKKDQKSTDYLPLPLHSVNSTGGTKSAPGTTRKLSSASTSRVRFQDSESPDPASTPGGGHNGRSSVEWYRGSAEPEAPPRSKASREHEREQGLEQSAISPLDEKEKDFDGLFEFRGDKPNPHDEKILQLRAEVDSMKRDKPPFVAAMDPEHWQCRDNSPGAEGRQKRPPDNLYDPFTGELVARLQAPSSNTKNANENGSGSDNSKERDDTTSTNPNDPHEIKSYKTSSAIWSQLAKIRSIQSDISTLHIQMEGVGAGVGHGPLTGRPFHRRNLSTVDLGLEASMMEDLDSDWGLDGKDVGKGFGLSTDVDFERLTGKLKGREEQIDRIMNQLDDLSKALREFHQIQMPTFEADANASGSGDSNLATSMGLHINPANRTQSRSRSTTLESVWSLSPLSHSPPSKSPLSLTWRGKGSPPPNIHVHGSSTAPNAFLSDHHIPLPPLTSPLISQTRSEGAQGKEQGHGAFSTASESPTTQSSPPYPPSPPNLNATSSASNLNSSVTPLSIPPPTTYGRPAAQAAQKTPNAPMPPLIEKLSSKPSVLPESIGLSDSPQEMARVKDLPATGPES